MKTIIILLLGFSIQACSSIPSLGYDQKVVVWHVNPADHPRFVADSQHCREVAAISHGDQDMVNTCIAQIGYKFEVVTQN